jgi:biotin synthase
MTTEHLKTLINKLKETGFLTKDEYVALIENRDADIDRYLFERSQAVSQKHFGNKVFYRGLIELSSYCKNDCYYCGIRKSNKNAERYRLDKDQILSCCETGYELGFRTFVLQGGEDPYFNDEVMCDIVAAIRNKYPDCAITLSLGERSRDSYEKLFDAGANRYLLRHETADSEHYSKLHPAELTLATRIKCLEDLKEIGYQVGCGFMVGSPFQTSENLAEDLMFIQDFQPEMVGIGPFIPHHDTPFADYDTGALELTLFMVALVRLILPNGLLPSTTALGTIDVDGREQGLLVGANVVMPNLSPVDVRKKYLLYDNKICTGEEAGECRSCLENRIGKIGYELVSARGDYIKGDENNV